MELKDLKSFINKKGDFTTEELIPNLFVIKHKNRKQSALTFIRFQEYYESPKYKNKKFSIEEFYNYYKNTHGSFSYHKNWAGFNFPSHVLHEVNKKMKLTTRENQIFNLLKNREKCYIIGVNKNEHKNTYRHEVAHGLYFLNKEYKKEVIKILKNKNLNPIKKILRKMGYHNSVLTDEVQAYLCFDLNDLKQFGLNVDPYRNLRKKLKKVFHKHFKN